MSRKILEKTLLLRTNTLLGCLSFMVLFTSIFASTPSNAEVFVSPKHVYIFQPGMDEVWGSYLFFVQNNGEPESSTFALPLPREQIDFGAQEGLIPKDLQFDPEKGVVVSKEFPAGSNLFGVGFKVAASGGEAKISLFIEAPKSNLTFLAPINAITVEGKGLVEDEEVKFGGNVFSSWKLETVEGGELVKVSVIGVGEGRGRFWLLGWAFLGVLFFVVSILVGRTLRNS